MNSVIGRELRRFVAPEFMFGIGARFQAGKYARTLGATRVLLVSDPGVMAAGWTKDVENALRVEGVESSIFHALTPNPKDHEVMLGAKTYHETNCQAIVAVGGGSVIDCAKGISIVVENGRDISVYEGVDRVPRPGPPLICIPTTAGTAADVSQFAIISIPARRVKIAVITKAIVPDVSLIDPETTTTMDPFLTACTGMDSLTHAVEAFVSNAHSPITDLHALRAIELIAANVETVAADLLNLEARESMMLGCLEAGLAFSNASLGAVHAMAHSLGGCFDLPHGECNAIILDHVLEYNFAAAGEKYKDIVKALGLEAGTRSPKELKDAIVAEIRRLRTEVGITRVLGEMGVHRTDVPELARNALHDPCILTNPRTTNQRDIEVIYEEAL